MSDCIDRIPSNRAEIWEELVISILAVNQYSLEKTYSLLPLLRVVGIVDPVNLTKWGVEDVVAQLKTAGCDRGPFMTRLFAKRLVSLGIALRSRGVEMSAEIILSNHPDAIRNLLLPVNGIGPKVLQNFFLLRGIKEQA